MRKLLVLLVIIGCRGLFPSAAAAQTGTEDNDKKTKRIEMAGSLMVFGSSRLSGLPETITTVPYYDQTRTLPSRTGGFKFSEDFMAGYWVSDHTLLGISMTYLTLGGRGSGSLWSSMVAENTSATSSRAGTIRRLSITNSTDREKT